MFLQRYDPRDLQLGDPPHMLSGVAAAPGALPSVYSPVELLQSPSPSYSAQGAWGALLHVSGHSLMAGLELYLAIYVCNLAIYVCIPVSLYNKSSYFHYNYTSCFMSHHRLYTIILYSHDHTYLYIILLCTCTAQGTTSTTLGMVAVGGTAPDFTLKNQNGEAVSLSSFRAGEEEEDKGKRVVVST